MPPFFQHFTVVSFLSVLILNLSVMEFGFDNSIATLVQAMDKFDRDFGMYRRGLHRELDPVKLSLLGSLGIPFRVVMILVALCLSERYGRWVVFVVMQLGSLAGTTVLFTARSFVQILIGRIVLTSFAGWHDWLVPMYLAELVPGPVRGMAIAFYMIFGYAGAFVASIAAYACSHLFKSSLEYRIPFGLMWVSPAICLSLCWILPESPRWLVRKGRDDAAVQALRRLNGSKNGYSAEEEARMLKESIEEDMETKGQWKDLFQGTNLRRSLTTLMCIFFVQFTGQAFITKYGAIFVKELGIMDPMKFALLEKGVGLIGPLFLIFFVDRLGRRKIYLVTGALYVCCMCIVGGIGMMAMQRVGHAIIALFIVSAILHIVAYHGVGMIVSAEVPHLRLRDKTLTLSYVFSFAGEFGVGFSLPYLLYAPYANLESKVGFIYGFMALLGVIWAYFFMPDAGNRSLEEMEELWQAGVAANKFSTYTVQGGAGLQITQLESHAGAEELSSSSKQRPTSVETEVGVKNKDTSVVCGEVVIVLKK